MIKTWQQRCEEHPDHQQGMVTEKMIQNRMQEEIDELRQALAQPEKKYDYRIKYDRPCYKCRSNFCPGNCKKPEYLAQPEQEPFGYFRYVLEWDGWVKTKPDDGKPLYTAPPSIEAAVLAEREACAKVCDLVAKEIDDTNGTATYCAAAIRARSEK